MVPVTGERILHQDDDSVAGRVDRIARRAGEIHSIVHPALPRDRVRADPERTGQDEGTRPRVHRRDGGDMGGLVSRRPGEGGDVVIRHGLDIGALLQPVQ